MTYFGSRPWLRWTVPAVAVAAIGGASVAATVTADASTPLPPRSAAQLLADVQQAQLAGLSGTVVQTSNLGLPEIPGAPSNTGLGGASSNLTSLVSGTHTLRVWYGGDQQIRIALLGSLGESDIIRNGRDLWVWSSQAKTATHVTLPAQSSLPAMPDAAAVMTPDEAAKKALAALDPSTSVTTEGSSTVAGRAAYELVLTPRDSGTLVRSVRIDIDAATHIPLRVVVYSTKVSNPAFEVGFTRVDFSAPEARQFTFDPPPGTTVTTHTLPDATGAPILTPRAGGSLGKADGVANPAPKVIGTGWSRVVVTTVPPMPASSDTGRHDGPAASPPSDTGRHHGAAPSAAAQLDSMLSVLPRVSGAWGSGRLFAGTMFSAVLTDDGRMAIGAVPPEQLYVALAAK